MRLRLILPGTAMARWVAPTPASWQLAATGRAGRLENLPYGRYGRSKRLQRPALSRSSSPVFRPVGENGSLVWPVAEATHFNQLSQWRQKEKVRGSILPQCGQAFSEAVPSDAGRFGAITSLYAARSRLQGAR